MLTMQFNAHFFVKLIILLVITTLSAVFNSIIITSIIGAFILNNDKIMKYILTNYIDLKIKVTEFINKKMENQKLSNKVNKVSEVNEVSK